MSPYVHVVYCDDVRHEVGNKFSIMGVYGADLLLTAFPATLSKLAAIISVVIPLDRKPSELIVRILLDEQVVFETPNMIELRQGATRKERTVDPSEEPLGALYGVQAILSPINFDKPSKLRVRAMLDGEVIKGNALAVKLRPQPEPPGER